MKTRPRLAVLIYVSSILTPYVFTIVATKISGLIVSLLVYLLAFMLLIFSSYVLIKASEDRSPKKWSPAIVGFAAVILFFISYQYQGLANNYLFFKWHESALNQFVTDIKDYGKIRQMNDGQHFWKKLNNVAVEPNRKDTISAEWPGEKQVLTTILEREGIDKTHYDSLRQQLIALGFIEFSQLSDGTWSFTSDGFLDNCYGYAYSQTGDRPLYNNCGEIVTWQKLSRHWYAWSTT